MIKRVFSNKSGFTLVEIVVAFAVFAIMAAAIMQILNLVSYEKSENVKFLDTLKAQEEKLAADGKQGFETQDGEVVLGFKDKAENKIGYDMKAANGDKEGAGDGLVYFVSKEQEGGNLPSIPSGGSGGGSGVVKGGEQGQLSAMDARITGSPKFDTITIDEVEKAADYTGEGVCYYIQMHASNVLMTEEEKKYAMFKINFFYPTTHTFEGKPPFVDSSNKSYTREEHDIATIIDAGYINSTSFDWSKKVSVVKEKNVSSGDNDKNPFCVTKLSDNTLRISSPYVNDNQTVEFNGSKKISIYVIFDHDPELSISSFGKNGASGVYRPCPIYKDLYNTDGTCKYEKDGDKTSNYIYGAFMYKRNYS